MTIEDFTEALRKAMLEIRLDPDGAGIIVDDVQTASGSDPDSLVISISYRHRRTGEHHEHRVGDLLKISGARDEGEAVQFLPAHLFNELHERHTSGP